jgi:hypothetical protein
VAASTGSTPAPRSPSAGTRIEPAALLGTEPTAAQAPTGPSAEREFFAERLAFFTQIACLASTGFLFMRTLIEVIAGRPPSTTSRSSTSSRR